MQVYATCVAIGSYGVLLLGESGMGKSDLALRLIDRGAKLVADDHVDIIQKGKSLVASSPESISGLLEVRGVGIFKLKPQKNVALWLVVQLVKPDWIERLPYPEPYEVLGVQVPCIRLSAFEHSAAIKVEMAVNALQDDAMTVGAFKE